MSQGNPRQQAMDQGLGEDPILYSTRLYVKFLQGLFNFLPHGHFHWEPDLEKTQIIITAEAPLDLEVVDKHPSIVVTMGPIQWSGLSIDNMLSFDPRTGERVRTDLMSGYFVPYCLAKSDVVALRLANIVAQGTRQHQRLLESPGGFHQIARPAPTINTPSPPGALVHGDPDNLVMVQVNIPFHLQWTWSETPQYPTQFRSLDMIMEKDRAVDYPYPSPVRVERVKLAMSTSPVTVRRISGRYAQRPQTTEIGTGIEHFQVTDLLPKPDEENP